MAYTSDQNAGGLDTLDNVALATGDLAIVGDVSDSNRAKAITIANLTTYLAAITQVFTNKTFDTAGTGNVFKINGTGITDKTGTGKVVLDTSPTLVTPALGTPSSGVLSSCTSLPASSVVAGTLGSGTFTTNNIIATANTVTVTTNAGTVGIANKMNNFTNSSASAMTITMTTTSALDGAISIVRIYDATAASKGITWVGTENSAGVSVPANSVGSTTIPLVVGFIFNGGTSKWTCVASS